MDVNYNNIQKVLTCEELDEFYKKITNLVANRISYENLDKEKGMIIEEEMNYVAKKILQMKLEK